MKRVWVGGQLTVAELSSEPCGGRHDSPRHEQHSMGTRAKGASQTWHCISCVPRSSSVTSDRALSCRQTPTVDRELVVRVIEGEDLAHEGDGRLVVVHGALGLIDVVQGRGLYWVAAADERKTTLEGIRLRAAHSRTDADRLQAAPCYRGSLIQVLESLVRPPPPFAYTRLARYATPPETRTWRR